MRRNQHPLPRLSWFWKSLSSLALLVGWALFLSAWLASVMVSGWGLTADGLIHLGALLESVRETTPAGFWLLFGLHASSLPLLIGIIGRLLRQIALPRGFRRTLRAAMLTMAVIDLSLWLMLPISPLARVALAPWLLLESALLLAIAALPVIEMWSYARWRSGGNKKRVVIVGGGFGGLYTAMALDRRLGYHDDLEIIVIDRKNYFLFPPLLPSVATGAIEARQVTNPFRRIFEATNIIFRKEHVDRIDPKEKRIYTTVSSSPDVKTGEVQKRQNCFSYDYLVLAPGSQTNTFGVPGVSEHAMFMRELGDALAFRNHIIDCFEQAAHETNPSIRRMLLRFVIVGAGPTGVELAGEAQELIQHILLQRYPEIDPTNVEVYLIQSGDRVLPGWHATMAEQTIDRLSAIQVKTLLNTRAVAVGPDSVTLNTGEILLSHTVVWCTGVKPAGLMARCGLAQDRRGRIKVAPDLRVPDFDDVFVLGDVALCTHAGRPLPAIAQVAVQQGDQTGPNLIRLLNNKPTRPFRYFDYGSLVCVGERFAVANILGIRFSGGIAWFVWRTLYLFKLVGVGNRIRVVLDWTLDLLIERSISQLRISRDDPMTA